jgi:hypothetical protein
MVFGKIRNKKYVIFNSWQFWETKKKTSQKTEFFMENVVESSFS